MTWRRQLFGRPGLKSLLSGKCTPKIWGSSALFRVLGMVLCAGSFAAIPLLKSFYLLMGTALVFGLGEAFVTSSTAALVADICQKKHFGTAMGTFGTIFDIGHASGPILAGLLLARYDYFISFLIMGAILIAAIPVFVLGVDEGRSELKEASKIT
ncbi:MAG: MFS transporter [Deltaproteobacteria bacterium]|nr:MFS transporter [Deltaproteobacteria bacterium]